ncbi:hypothetical protein TWF481_001466 [Arthrobotrys musiformis]|uniref:Uncharacterized protein n=1 Tax=Arthrobotrys musiformis TaxID=47236 RepID=A0AAV9WRQ6_9PEZI
MPCSSEPYRFRFFDMAMCLNTILIGRNPAPTAEDVRAITYYVFRIAEHKSKLRDLWVRQGELRSEVPYPHQRSIIGAIRAAQRQFENLAVDLEIKPGAVEMTREEECMMMQLLIASLSDPCLRERLDNMAFGDMPEDCRDLLHEAWE